MRVLLIGSGGREHALAWKLVQSPLVDRLLIVPGNAGTAEVGQNVCASVDDLDGLVRIAVTNCVDMVVVGPEAPLVAGVVDKLTDVGIKAFGPTAAAARIEGSKAWTYELLVRYGVPTAHSRRFTNSIQAIQYAESLAQGSYVVKADGLASGKGVVVPDSHEQAKSAIVSMLDASMRGATSHEVLIAERLVGWEVSVFAFVDGDYVSAEIAACDYKRISDGDRGPNTGGMGAYLPPEQWSVELSSRVRAEILQPVASAMVAEGCPYRGVLYAGIMVTAAGPKVFEFNCRLGDPEAEIILPALSVDLAELCLATIEGRLSACHVEMDGSARVGVVIASQGYPGLYKTGLPISGLDKTRPDILIFHSGTTLNDDKVVTAGGRVLVVVASGPTVPAARKAAYAAVSDISFDGAIYRKDIAASVLKIAREN